HPTYWPRFPYRSLARYYNVFLPMAYATDRHIRGVEPTRAYNAADVAIIRERTGKPHVPIHLIGGIANAMGPKETAGFMQAVGNYAIWDGWIIAALVLWAISGALGQRTGAAYMQGMNQAKELDAAGKTGPNEGLLALNRTQAGLILDSLTSLAVLLILLDMI